MILSSSCSFGTHLNVGYTWPDDPLECLGAYPERCALSARHLAPSVAPMSTKASELGEPAMETCRMTQGQVLEGELAVAAEPGSGGEMVRQAFSAGRPPDQSQQIKHLAIGRTFGNDTPSQFLSGQES